MDRVDKCVTYTNTNTRVRNRKTVQITRSNRTVYTELIRFRVKNRTDREPFFIYRPSEILRPINASVAGDEIEIPSGNTPPAALVATAGPTKQERSG